LRDLTRAFGERGAERNRCSSSRWAPMLGFAAQFEYSRYVELLLATPVVVVGRLAFFRKFWLSLKNRSPTCTR